MTCVPILQDPASKRSAGHPASKKRTQVGDLDTPKGTAYNGPDFAVLLVDLIWVRL